MKIEGHSTVSTTSETVEVKAERILLLEENGRLREAIQMARQCICAGDVIGAHGILINALSGGNHGA
jgi:hypothetical protein